jgi:hypothetical protein
MLDIPEFRTKAEADLVEQEDQLQFPSRLEAATRVSVFRPRLEFDKIGLEQSNIFVLNNSTNSEAVVADRAQLKNYLIFVNSSLGVNYYLSGFRPTSFYGREQDFFYPEGRGTAMLGRYLVFRVNEPSAEVRLVLSVTSSTLGGGRVSLPSPTVAGEAVVEFGMLGQGSARIVSPPLRPLTAGGAHYLLLDLGRDAAAIPTPRTGLMNLYGTSILIDYRRVVTRGRHISLVDAAKFDTNDRPDGIRLFPKDLGDERLEYSGIYEDGWLGDAGFVILAGQADAKKIVIRGLLPMGIGLDSVDVAFQTNDGPKIHRTLTLGNFEVELPTAGSGPQRIEFRFSGLGHLPVGDRRPVTVQLMSMELAK